MSSALGSRWTSLVRDHTQLRVVLPITGYREKHCSLSLILSCKDSAFAQSYWELDISKPEHRLTIWGIQ
jgi:hypothetical protein